MSRHVELFTLTGFPLVQPGDSLTTLILQALQDNHLSLQDRDVVVLAQKVVSKAEDRYVSLSDITPSEAAQELADKADKDPRQMQVLLNESREVIKTKLGVVIVEHNNGYVHANAGIDQSNIEQNGDERLLLLPENPDQSAEQLKQSLEQASGTRQLAIVINDSFGRAWRNGTCGVCIGAAGFAVIDDKIGESDLFGNELKVTQAAVADEIAAAASLVMGQADEGTPVVIIRGLNLMSSDQGSETLIRAKQDDLFR